MENNELPTYVCTRDRQGGTFGMYRRYCAEEWKEQAMEWANQDGWGNEDGEFDFDTEEELIGYIEEIWDLEIEKVDKDNVELQEYVARELASIKNNPDYPDDSCVEFIYELAKDIGML